MVEITFPDGNKKQYEAGVTGLQVATDISEGLARAALAVEIDGKLVDITTTITTDCKVRIITFRDSEGVKLFWHSSAHLLAHAVQRLYPEALPTIGPAVENGFYYDFDNLNITMDDFPKIEAEMKKIVEERIEPKRIEYASKEEAIEAFKDNPYKVEMINRLDEGSSAYQQGDFIDLCRGPHIPNTKVIKAFKLMKLAGAYWRGDSKNKMLTRVYGVSFPDKKDLKEHLHLLEEAEKRDHRKIGKHLDLFSFQDEAPGMPFFHDKGAFMWNQLVNYLTELLTQRDYELIKTPYILNKELWLQSGHWDHYKENMYFTKIDSDEENFAVKPMNCPAHLLVYKNKMYSYRDLPLRMGEFGLVHRHELSGVLSGLFRVRMFTQDDAHVFCTEEQIKSEVKELIELMNIVYTTFGFDYAMELSTKPEKAMGDPKKWELAETILEEVLNEQEKEWKLNPGDGAFYGPKIDFHIKDALGRSWQCGTIQLDFQMPEKFRLTYEGKDGTKHQPVMLHRAVLGSVERFLGNVIEQFAGKFPLWISPNQIAILPIADRHLDYAQQVAQEFKVAGLRTEVDARSESVNKKVRDAQLSQFNYILVVGDKEAEEKTVNVRKRNNEVLGEKKLDEFKAELLAEVAEKRISNY
ncbi:threonine--tRNA ligase [Candidatus Woesearchaeota archaeon]|nr:threonine--tRNA ligase [Candidatus Woesearchaeota archaeon]